MYPVALLSLLFLGLASPDTKPAVTVTVRENADVSGSSFTLGDIAVVSGTDKALAARVAAVQVGTSPLPGLRRPLQPADILIRLRFNHLDPKNIALICPPQIHVTRAGNETPVDDLVQAALSKLTEERKKLNDGATLEPAQLPVTGFVAPGKREYQASVVRGSLETGPVVMQVAVLVDGKPARTVEIPFRIKRMVTALLAKRVLAAHAVLTADDVTSGSIEAAAGTAAPLTDLQAVLGKRTTRQILQGAPLTESCVEIAPIIASGAQVTLELVVGGVHLSTPAIARAQGAIGQTIRVYATETRKEFTATVVDATTVRLEESR